MKIIVCVKQVPDTSGKVAVNPDGTLNRASMQTITNPDDKNAIEAALKLKDETGCRVTAVTMGPPPAEGMLRELIAMGCDDAVLISGREFGGSDTFATSQIIAAGINAIGLEKDDIVFCGRQAIDGDTAQVGPQVAEKLGMTQVTYAQEILDVKDGKATILRSIDGGVETVEAPLPLVVTVNGTAAPCRPQNVRLVMKYKWATCPSERPADDPHAALYAERPYLTLTQWTVADVDGDPSQCGFAGSPTRVKSVQNIVFQAKESKTLTASDADVEGLVQELISEKIIG